MNSQNKLTLFLFQISGANLPPKIKIGCLYIQTKKENLRQAQEQINKMLPSSDAKRDFSVKCEINVYRNGLKIFQKKKSKISNLTLNLSERIFVISEHQGKGEEIVFELKRLKNIHKKFIDEGKMTLEFTQVSQASSFPKEPKSESIIDNKSDRLSQVFIESASSENLKLMVRKIVQEKEIIKKQEKALMKLTNNKNPVKQVEERKKQKKNVSITEYEKPALYAQNLQERKRDPLSYSKHQRVYQNEEEKIERFSRKELMKSIYDSETSKEERVQKRIEKFEPRQCDILSLPANLLTNIFSFCGVELKHRLISKKYEGFVLKNIKNIHFKEQVDETTFNKLGRLAINVRGRLKNIRSLDLIDKYDEPELQQNRAKSLYFGSWKEMSKKNVAQLKGLRLFLLEIPYQIKFDLSNLYGIKLRELHLHSKYVVSTPNSFIQNEHIVHIFRHTQKLEAFSIPYINSSVVQEILQYQEKVKQMRQLRFGTINIDTKENRWAEFGLFQNLKNLEIENVLKGGLVGSSKVALKLSLPEAVESLKLGHFIDKDLIGSLPMNIRRLALCGQGFLNQDLIDICLPYLKKIDVTECPNIRPSMIQNLSQCQNLRLISNWDRQGLDYWINEGRSKGIEVVSVRDMRK